MNDFKFLVPEQIIFKLRSMFTNVYISYWSDIVSIEEGLGRHTGYGHNYSICNLANKVCKPLLVNRKINKFNRP